MADKDVSITVGVDNSALTAGLAQAQASVKAAAAQMSDSLSSLSNAASKVRNAMIGVTAILAGGAIFGKAVSATVEWDSAALKLSKALGTTTEQASVYMVAMKHLGIESDVLITASVKMSKQIFANGEAFTKMGIQVRDSNGHFRDAGTVLRETISKLAEIKNPIAQNITGFQLFGGSWAEMKPLVKLTADEMQNAERRARELGLIVGPEGAAQARAYKLAMNDVKLVGQSLEITLGRQLLPTLTNLGTAFASSGPTIATTFGNVLKGIAVTAMIVWTDLQKVGLALGALAASAAALFHGDLVGAKDIWKQWGNDADDLQAKLETFYEKAMNPPPPAASKAPDIAAGGDGLGNSSLKDKIDEMLNYSNELLARVYTKQAENARARMAIQEWFHKRDVALEAEAVDQKKALGLDALSTQREQLQALASAGIITRDQELKGLRENEDAKFAIENEAAQRKYLEATDSILEAQKAYDEIERLAQAHQNRLAQIEQQQHIQSGQKWREAFQGIQSGFQNVIAGFLKGTMTIKGLLQGMVGAVLDAVVGMVAKVIAQWLVLKIAHLLMSKTAIVGESAKAGAAGTASWAGAPWPINIGAPAFGAAMAAAAGAYAAIPAAAQGYDIPAGVNPLVQAHQREMILPEKHSDVIRRLADGGAGGAPLSVTVRAVSQNDLLISRGDMKKLLQRLGITNLGIPL